MSVKNFKFVSPGVFINEIDNSFIPKSADAIGPCVIGRSRRGLAMEPIRVESYSKFVEMFGDTVPGNGGGDVYRQGNFQSPMYGGYAAKAFLRSNVAPLTYIRLLGQQTNVGKAAGGDAAAGWKTTNNLSSTGTSNGGAYGIWLFKSASDATKASTTFTISASSITEGSSGSLELTSSDGTARRFMVVGTDGAANGDNATDGDGVAYVVVKTGSSTAAIVSNLMEAITSSNGLSSKMTATSPSAGKVDLTQSVGGPTGDKPITSNAAFNAYCSVNPASQFEAVGTMGRHAMRRLTGSTYSGQLAAILYLQAGTQVALEGTIYGSGSSTSANARTASAGALIDAVNSEWTLVVTGANQSPTNRRYTISFDDSSENFIRKKLNTNPQLKAGQDFYPNNTELDFFLGETFEQEVRDAGLTSGEMVAMIAGIAKSGSVSTGPQNMKGQASREAVAGWFIGQDLGASGSYIPQNAQKLFRLKGRGHGEWLNRNVKVSIAKLRPSNTTTSDYGTFSLILRDINDTDNNVIILERYDNLTLDPTSTDFIGRRVGDKYQKWDPVSRRLKQYGEYPNMSKFVYVEMNADVEAGATDSTLLPFGYFGPPKMSDVTLNNEVMTGSSNSYVIIDPTLSGFSGVTDRVDAGFVTGFTGSVLATLKFPSVRLRTSASAGGLTDPTDAYFGMMTTRTTSSTSPDASVADPHRTWYANFPDDPSSTSITGFDSYAYVMSLDDVVSGSQGYYYESGSRAAGNSVGNYKTLLDAGYDKFTSPLWGGFDGFDITKPDPLYNKGFENGTEDNSYAYHTIRRAIDTVADPEFLNMNMLTMPGLTNGNLTTQMIRTCEERADSMALIDLPNVYLPPSEVYYADKSQRIATTPTNAANDLKARRIDSSYGCTFYPWVQTRDENTGLLVWIPPSVAMMGVLGSSEAKSDIWFAPAGFNRGGLTEGAAGIPVTSVTERLTSKERDTLYEARINPIASFPSTGIVVFGQKTLQERQSALDRINVRRLVIYLKKQISIISTQILFKQNVQATWDRFKSLIEPFLANVKTRFGITDYRLILDESTTTPDLIDQNILYAKIMVKPARAIEFIAIDFVIASTGASFDD